MTVARDAVLEASAWNTTPDPFTFTFTPVGTPRGVYLGIVHGTVSDDLIDAPATYGGVTMARVDTAADIVGEPGRSYLYFLGSSIPTGAQTVSIPHTATTTIKWAICGSVTAAADTEIVTFSKLEGDQTDPQIAVNTGATSALRIALMYNGTNGIANIAILAGMETLTTANSHDFGNFIGVLGEETTASAGSYTIGWTLAVTDDLAMIAAAIQEVAGAVTAAPYPYVGGGYYPTEG